MPNPDLYCRRCGWVLASDYVAADRSGEDYCAECEKLVREDQLNEARRREQQEFAVARWRGIMQSRKGR